MIFLNSSSNVLFQGANKRGDHNGLKGNYFTKGLWYSSGIELTYKNIPKINTGKSTSAAITLLSPTELIEWSEEDEV